jgi:hypothetical protein
MPQLKRWSMAIESGSATVDNPLNELVIHWLTRQKAVSESVAKESRISVKSLVERQSEMQEKQMEF